MSDEHKLNHTTCPMCNAEDGIAFHGDRPEDQCSGCHVIVCNACQAGFDLLYSAGASQCTELDEVKTRIAARWNNYREASPVAMAPAKGLH
jgi:hypothetical protein